MFKFCINVKYFLIVAEEGVGDKGSVRVRTTRVQSHSTTGFSMNAILFFRRLDA